MKYCFAYFPLCAALLMGCSDGPTPPKSDNEQFELVSYFGKPLPVEMSRSELIENAQPTGIICTDTLYHQNVLLFQKDSAARSTTYVEQCSDGRPRQQTIVAHRGTYTVSGDTIFLELLDPTRGSYGQRLIRFGPDELRIPFTIYSEAHPEGDHVEYLVYHRWLPY